MSVPSPVTAPAPSAATPAPAAVPRERRGIATAPPAEGRRRVAARFGLRRALTLLVGGTVAVLLGRALWDSALDRLEARRAVHADRSTAESGVQAELPRLASVTYRTLDGREVRALVDAHRLSEFVRERVAWIEANREPLRREAHTRVEQAAAPTFDAMDGRVGGYVDWYLAWGTGYELLGVAALSAASHALEPRVMDLREAVSLDLERHVERRYRDQVLQPESSDPALRDAFAGALATLHGRVMALVATLDAAFQAYLARESALLDTARVRTGARLVLDWTGRVRRLTLPDLGAGLVEPLRGAALAAGGAVAGVAAGRGAARALTADLATRSLAPSGARLGARLAGPATGRLLAGVAGASAGAAAGPIGAALGGALGLGLDYAVTATGAALQRPEVEAAVRASLAAHRQEWTGLMQGCLAGAVDTWLDDLQAHLVEQDLP